MDMDIQSRPEREELVRHDVERGYQSDRTRSFALACSRVLVCRRPRGSERKGCARPRPRVARRGLVTLLCAMLNDAP